MTKKSKSIIITLAIISVVLFVVSVFSIIYNFNGGFYLNKLSSFSKILGEEQTIEITGEGNYVTACNFSGKVLLNDDIRQDVFIKASNLSLPLYLRAKIEVVQEKDSAIMFGYTNWIQQENQPYIYFNQQLRASEQIGLCKYVRFSEKLKTESNKNYILVFIVEASLTPFDV